MKEFITNFEFKNNRNYVHSTTMIEQLRVFVYEDFQHRDKWELPKIDAKFHKEVLYNGKYLIAEDLSELPESRTVSADFRFYDRNQSIYAVFIEDKAVNVVRRIKTNYSVEDIVMERDFCGTCKIGCPSSKAYVENMIEANKRIHLLTLKEEKNGLKVINLYMKKFPFYPPVTSEEKAVMIRIENISIRYREGSVATLNSLYFPQLVTERFEMAYIVEGL